VWRRGGCLWVTAPRQWPRADALQAHRKWDASESRLTKRGLTAAEAMPSSREAVATSARISPAFKFRSATRRSLREQTCHDVRQTADCDQNPTTPLPPKSPGFAMVMRHCARQARGIDKNEGRTRCVASAGKAIVDFVPQFRWKPRGKARGGNFDARSGTPVDPI